MARAAARGRRADRHRRHQGRRARQGRRRVHHHHRRRRRAARASTSPATARGRATRSSSAARSATTAWRSCRCARTCRSRRRSSRTPPRCTSWSRRCSRRCPDIHCLRDPTRGGLATTLNELAAAVGLRHADPRGAHAGAAEVAAACEFLGLDPLYVANEGKLVAICAADDAERLLAAMRAHPLGRDAAIIGEAIADPHHFVQMETVVRRPAHRRLADRRAAAAHLLSGRRGSADAHPVPHPRVQQPDAAALGRARPRSATRCRSSSTSTTASPPRRWRCGGRS